MGAGVMLGKAVPQRCLRLYERRERTRENTYFCLRKISLQSILSLRHS